MVYWQDRTASHFSILTKENGGLGARVYSAHWILLIFTTILQRRNCYVILQIRKQTERLIFTSPCNYTWWEQIYT